MKASHHLPEKLSLFVHRASECLTDHEAHGEGLICFSLLKGLVDRGHRIFAYTNRVAVRDMPQGLIVRSGQHRVPANSLAPWEHTWRATRWLRQLIKEEPIDLVWHMNPAGGGGCPRPPQTFGKPLVVGPLYYGWPDTPGQADDGETAPWDRFTKPDWAVGGTRLAADFGTERCPILCHPTSCRCDAGTAAPGPCV